MNRFLLLFLVLFVTTKTNSQPQYFNLKPMEGYFLNDEVPLKKGLNFFVISNREKFIKHFGLINKSNAPNFDYNHIIVMALPPSKMESKIAFLPKAARAGNYIEVYCEIEKKKHSVPYTTYPIVVATIPKYFSVTKVNFYNNENKKLLESVQIK